MSKDAHSTALYEGTTLDDDYVKQQETRTTFSGKPITRDHDNLSGMMLGDGGGFASGSATANILPPGYTDRSLVRIPIKMADVEGTTSIGNDVQTEKKGGLFSKFSSKRKGADDEVKVVMMSRGDYLKYWLKGPDGKFADSTEEPPEGRKKWLRQQLELNEEWKQNDPSLVPGAKGKPQGLFNKLTGSGATLSLG